MENEVEKKAEEHWDWIEQVLANRQAETKHMFIEGFKHGYKHGVDDAKKRSDS